MSLHSPILADQFRDYIANLTINEHPIQQKIRAENINHKFAHMQIPSEQAAFLTILLKILNVNKALELGVFLGYSAISIARGLNERGTLIACEKNPIYAGQALDYISQTEFSNKVEIRVASALTLQNELIRTGNAGQFDFIFIDADKENYENYYEKGMTLVRSGGVIVIDNVLWYGRVIYEKEKSKITNKIKELNIKISNDNRIESIIVPLGDGMTIIRKK